LLPEPSSTRKMVKKDRSFAPEMSAERRASLGNGWQDAVRRARSTSR
jgi:glycerol kinase